MEKGKQDPIRTTIDDERKAQRELLINDGDMSFISSDDEDFRWIDDYANGRIPVGLDTGDSEMDEHFRYKKEFVIVNGHSNVGKTTMVLYLMVNAASAAQLEVGGVLFGEPNGFTEDVADSVRHEPQDLFHEPRSAQVEHTSG